MKVTVFRNTFNNIMVCADMVEPQGLKSFEKLINDTESNNECQIYRQTPSIIKLIKEYFNIKGE